MSENRHEEPGTLPARIRSTCDVIKEEGDGAEIPLTTRELKDLRSAFKIFDRDGTGSIDPRNLGTVMKSLGQNPTEAEVQDLISTVDHSDSGSVDFEEFQRMMVPKLREPERAEDMRDCFKVFDRDGNDIISLDDLEQLFSQLGQDFTRHEIKDMLDVADVDGDKKVTFEDFLSIMKEG